MDGRKAANHHAVFVENDLVIPFIGELVNLELTTSEINESGSVGDAAETSFM